MWTPSVGGGRIPAPRPIELAGSAVRLARTHYRALFPPVAVVLLPALAVGSAALGYWRFETSSRPSHDALASLAEVVGLVVVVLGNLFAQAAGVHAATGAVVGARPDWRASCRAALARWRSVVGSGLAVSVLACLGLVVFVVPGIVLWLTWYVAMPVVVMERARTRQALARSASLVRGCRPTVLGAFLLVELLVVACSLLVADLAGVLFSHSRDAELVAGQVAAYAVEILLTPAQLALVVLVYLDLRARREGVPPTEVARAAGVDVAHGVAAGGWGSDGATQGSRDLGTHAPLPVAPWAEWHEPSPPSPSIAEPAAEPPSSGPGQLGWPAVSPKPSRDGPTRRPSPSWPAGSPKPPPPARRAAPPPVAGGAGSPQTSPSPVEPSPPDS